MAAPSRERRKYLHVGSSATSLSRTPREEAAMHGPAATGNHNTSQDYGGVLHPAGSSRQKLPAGRFLRRRLEHRVIGRNEFGEVVGNGGSRVGMGRVEFRLIFLALRALAFEANHP